MEPNRPASDYGLTVKFIFGITLLVSVVLSIYFAYTGAHHERPYIRTACLSNMKQEALAVIMYSIDWDEKLPPAATWADSSLPYSKNKDIYRCPPVSHQPDQYGHAFWESLSMRESTRIPGGPADIPMIFDSIDLSWNAHGPLSLIPPGGRGKGGLVVVAFLDGHATSRAVSRVTATPLPGPPTKSP